MDGVTTVITGNCGLSRTNLQQYFSLLDSLHLAVNAGSLIGRNDAQSRYGKCKPPPN